MGPSQGALNIIKNREGFKPFVYQDSLGFLTAGYGHKLTTEDMKKYRLGDPVSQKVSDEWLQKDATNAFTAASQQATQLGINDKDFLDALTSVNYQLGPNWWDDSVNPRAHKKTWELLKNGDYLKAGKEVYDSEWAKQTPQRVDDFANAINRLAAQEIRDTDLERRDTNFKPSIDPQKKSLSPLEAYFEKQIGKQQAQTQFSFFGPDLFGKPSPPSSYLETFDRAVKAGTDQFTADAYNFGAIFDFIGGEEEKAKAKLRRGDVFRTSAAEVLDSMGSFAEFADNPTLDGFATQFFRAVGLVTPQALASVSTGFSGAILGGIGKGVITVGAKKYVTNKTEDLMKKYVAFRNGKGPNLTKLEKDYLEQAYQGVSASKFYTKAGRGALPTVLDAQKERVARRVAGIPLYQTGFWTGSFLQSEVVGASQSLEEFREAGYELTDKEAKAALAIGVPQALLDVIGEKVFYSMMFKTAAKDLVKGDMKAGEALLSIAAAFPKGFVKSGIAEGLTELGQEEIVLRQRFAIDPDYSQELANMRRAEAAFVGAMAGGARGAPANVMAKSYNLLFGPERTNAEDLDLGTGEPRRESPNDLEAQILAVNAGDKPAVWIPNITEADLFNPEVVAQTPELSKATLVSEQIPANGIIPNSSPGVLVVKGKSYGRKKGGPFVPLKSSQDLINKIVSQGATDEVLTDILGFTEVPTPDHMTAIVVRDQKGNLIERQTVSEKNVTKALQATKRRYLKTKYTVTQEDNKPETGVGGADREDPDLQTRRVGDERVEPITSEDIELTETGITTSEKGQRDEGIVITGPGFVKDPKNNVDYFFPVRTEAQKNEQTPEQENRRVTLIAEEGGNLGQFIAPKDRIDTPLRALQLLQQLKEKYPTTDFRLQRTTQGKRNDPNTKLTGFKILAEGDLVPDIKISVQDAVKEARNGLEALISGEGLERTSAAASRFRIFKVRQADGTETDVALNNLLSNPELVDPREVRNTLSGIARQRKQLQELLGSLALAEATLVYRGDDVLDAEQVSEIDLAQRETTSKFSRTKVRLQGPITEGEAQSALRSVNRRIVDANNNIEELILNSIDERGDDLIDFRDPTAQTYKTKAGKNRLFEFTLPGGVKFTPNFGFHGADPELYNEFLLKLANERGIPLSPSLDANAITEEFKETFGSPIGEDDGAGVTKLEYVEADFKSNNVLVTRMNIADGAPDTYLRTESQTLQGVDQELVDAEREGRTKRPSAQTKKFRQQLKAPEFDNFTDQQNKLIGAFKKLLDRLGYKRDIYFHDIQKELPVEISKQLVSVSGKGNPRNVADTVRAEASNLRRSLDTAGIIFTGDSVNGVDIVLTDTNKIKTEADFFRYVVESSHEVGHALFNQYKNDVIGTPLGKLIIKDFNKAKKRLEAEGNSKYSGKNGLDEYFSDQFTIWVRKTAAGESAKNRAEGFFKQMVTKFKELYDGVINLLYKSRLNPEYQSDNFDAFMQKLATNAAKTPPTPPPVPPAPPPTPATRPGDETDIRDFNRTPRRAPAKVKRGPYKKPTDRPDVFVGAYYRRDQDTIFIDEEYIRSQFNEKPWTKPRVEGVNPLPSEFTNQYIKTPDDWVRFVELHEQAHTEYAQLEGESTATYENRMNDIAMAEMRDPKLFGADTTPATPATPATPEVNQVSESADAIEKGAATFENHTKKVQEKVKQGEQQDAGLTLNEKVEAAEVIEESVKQAKKFGVDRKTLSYVKRKAIEMLKGFGDATVDVLPNDKKHWNTSYIFRTGYGYMRSLGKEAEALANQMYSQSVRAIKQGFLNRRTVEFNLKLTGAAAKDPSGVGGVFRVGNDYFYTDGEIDFKRFAQAALLAEDDKVATKDIKAIGANTEVEGAKLIRQWLESLFDNYIQPSGININKKDNFYTRVWDIAKLVNKPEERGQLASLLKQYNPKVKEIKLYGKTYTTWEQFVDAWLSTDEQLDTSNVSVGLSSERQQYFNNIPNNEARDLGLLVDPVSALKNYIETTTKKVEYHTRITTTLTAADLERAPQSLLDDLKKEKKKAGDTVNGYLAAEVQLNRISDPIKQQGARDAMRHMLGKVGYDMSPFMRKLNSYGLLLNMLTLLPFATIASIPDLAGPMIRSKGLISFKDYFAEFKYAFANQKEATQFAQDLGLVTNDAIHTMYVNAYELGYMTEGTKKVAEGFFKGIQLDWYTKFSRAFAAGMGQRFLIALAREDNKKNNESLSELELTRQDIINAYDRDSGTLNTNNPKIADALRRFVEEAIIRPNAAERPIWANNPYLALVFQLKSFFYAFGANIMGGLFRQSKSAYNRDGVASAAVPLVLGASVLLPLSAFGLELREFIKYLGRGLTPGFLERPLRGVEVEDTFSYTTAFRTDGMPWPEYLLEIMDRSGIFGPFTMIFPMADNPKFGDAWFTPALGPTAERIEDLLIDGEFRFNDIYPF